MACEICLCPIRQGQLFVSIRGWVQIRNAHNQIIAEPVDLEDGSQAKYAHWGCLMKKIPALVGIHIGVPSDG